jgi:hypothetical protein
MPTEVFLMMVNEAEFFTALRCVIAAFEALGIEYALGGSFASSLYGEARATRDVDLISSVAGHHAKPLVAALGAAFYADEDQILHAAMNQSSFNLIHLESMAKVDVFVVWRTDFGRSQLARRQEKRVGRDEPFTLYLTSPEDTVLAKLDWYRIGNCVSDRQWRDVQGVLKVQARSLDFPYLHDWARKMNLQELLARALEDAGLDDDFFVR